MEVKPFSASRELPLGPIAGLRSMLDAGAGHVNVQGEIQTLNWRVLGTGLSVAVVLLVLFFSLRGCRGRQSDPLKKLGPGIYQPTNATGELLPLPEKKK